MNKVFGSLAVSMLCLACSSGGGGGSGGGAGGGGGTGGGGGALPKHTVTANFAIKKADGSPDTCPMTYTSVKLEAQARSASLNTATGDPFTTIVDCAAGKATLALQISGDEPSACDAAGNCTRSTAMDISGIYDITLIISEPTGQTDYWVVLTQRIDLSQGDGSLNFTLYPNASFRLYNWGLHGTMVMSDLATCAAANIDTVRVTTTRVLTPDGNADPAPKTTVDTYPCNSDVLESGESFLNSAGAAPNTVGAGLSSPLEYGYYSSKLEALRAGVVIGTYTGDASDMEQVQRTDFQFSTNGSYTLLPFEYSQYIDIPDH